MHATCLSFYKALQKKMSKNAAYKSWWVNKSEDSKRDYYLERMHQKDKCDNAKMRMPKVDATVAKSTKVRKQRALRNRFIPFEVFAEKHPGTAPEKVKAMWRAKLIDPTVKKTQYNGQVLICQFQGIDMDALDIADVGVSFNESFEVKDKASLEVVQELGKSALEKADATRSRTMGCLVQEGPNGVDLPAEAIEGMTSIGESFLTDQIDLASKDLEVLVSMEEAALEAQAELDRQEALEVSIFKASNEELVRTAEEASMNKGVDKAKVNLEMRVGQSLSLWAIGATEAKVDAEQSIRQVSLVARTLGELPSAGGRTPNQRAW